MRAITAAMRPRIWKLKRTAQCAKCPWIAAVDPHDIPNGYSEAKHRALKGTIADPNNPLSTVNPGPMRAMACHETQDAHCIGWLMNQLGPGNNIGLRLAVQSCSNLEHVRLRGDQHATFDETLPKGET